MKSPLTPQDELDFYLVEAGLKPAAYTHTHLRFQKSGKVSKKDKSRAQDIYDKIASYEILLAHLEENLFPGKLTISFIGANSKRRLNRLIRAHFSCDYREIGLSLGYPRNAVFSNPKTFKEDKRCNEYNDLEESLKKSGFVFPTFFYFLNHTPGNFSFSNGIFRISKSSEAQARVYQRYVRRYNPDLARRLEEHIDFN
ncbi:MAG: hypothetical protein Q8N99_08925 [Nanoarchaeota archaeon]|nr:hypothetical protein [Nanoarchaeota archaeon]